MCVWPSVRENLLEKMTELNSKIDSDSEPGVSGGLWNPHPDVWQLAAACLKDEIVTGLHCRPIHPPTAFQSFHEPDRPVLRPHSTRHGGPASAQLGTTTYSAEYVTRTARPGAPAPKSRTGGSSCKWAIGQQHGGRHSVPRRVRDGAELVSSKQRQTFCLFWTCGSEFVPLRTRRGRICHQLPRLKCAVTTAQCFAISDMES